MPRRSQEIGKIYRIYEQALEDSDCGRFRGLVKLAVELVQNNHRRSKIRCWLQARSRR